MSTAELRPVGRQPLMSGPIADAWRRRALVTVVCLIPLTFVGVSIGGFNISGLAWVAGLLVVAPLVVLDSVDASVLRRALPYLVFVFFAALSIGVAPLPQVAVASTVQMTAPLPAFLLASRIQDIDRFLDRAATAAQGAIGLAALLTVATTAGALPGTALSARPMAISLVVLFVIASLRLSPARAYLLGGVALTLSVATGGRTSSAVLLMVLVLSPALRLRWRGRIALAGLGLVAVVLASQTAAFQERFFFGAQGTLTDALTGSEVLNTAGRRELWPRLLDECSTSPILGGGIGTGTVLSNELTLGVLGQPHNDYLKTYCDVGLLGAVPFWLFFVGAGLSGVALARRGEPLGQASSSLVLALLVLAVTDNPVIYTAHFMVPLAVVLGLAARGPRSSVRPSQSRVLPES